MDLKTMLNEGSGPAGAPAPGKPPPPPRPAPQQQRQQPPPPQPHMLPSTPVQTAPPHSFRDHPHSAQPSPDRTMSREYHPSHGTPFTSPPPYGAPAPYAPSGRPQPPPLQQLSSNNDMRSPSAGPAFAQSPYTRNPSAPSVRADSVGYPFPSPGHPHPDSVSPVQQHRYPPSSGYPPRDSYSQPSGPMASPAPMGAPPPGYFPGHQPMPQTPPVGTPGGAHPYLNQQRQRSSSAQSHHSYPPQAFASPITMNHPPPQPDHMRHPSQPSTPHGAPLSAGPRPSTGAGTFAQPQSPYQSRVSSSGAPYPSFPPQQQQQPPLPPQHHQQQPSPHVTPRPQPSPRPPVQRALSVYDQGPGHPYAVDPHRMSLSQSDRDRSVSVSPKTRIPSLPSSTGHHSQTSFSGPSGQPAEHDPRDPRQTPSNTAQMRDAPVKLEREAPPIPAPRTERASTPAKRKMDDRDIKPDELDQQESRPPPFQANGAHRPGSSSRPAAAHHPDVPMQPRRKRRHAAPPIWAHPYDRQQLKNPNYLLRKPAANHIQVNGTSDSSSLARQDRATSRHVSPETSRSNAQGPPPNQAPPVAAIANKPNLLGPWETTIANQDPFDEMCKTVADFFFFNVINPTELGELHGRPGIQFEIEAKLGCLMDRNPQRQGARYHLPVRSEVVLSDEDKNAFAFSSSMTEVSNADWATPMLLDHIGANYPNQAQHRNFNEYLNALVADTSPQNPKNKNSPTPRVPVNYVHTREIDRFYRLPEGADQNFHPILRHLLAQRRDPAVRVTTERTGRVVAKIVKVKVADLHLHFPQCDLDCRISVNVEIEWEGAVDGLEQVTQDGAARGDKPDRHKDRLSYTQGNYKVDLTQVTQPEAGGQVRQLIRLEAGFGLRYYPLYIS